MDHDEKTHDEQPTEGEGPYPDAESTPVDIMTERLEFKAKALGHARRAVRDTAIFGSSTPVDPAALLAVADWLLDEHHEHHEVTLDLSGLLASFFREEAEKEDPEDS